jgi:CBS domain containing-hemolysin-like protein
VGGTGVGVTTFSTTRSTGVPSTISVTTTVWMVVCGWAGAHAARTMLNSMSEKNNVRNNFLGILLSFIVQSQSIG